MQSARAVAEYHSLIKFSSYIYSIICVFSGISVGVRQFQVLLQQSLTISQTVISPRRYIQTVNQAKQLPFATYVKHILITLFS
jgi:hypothetical protein